uniref:Uncharacterized protein n=1 Tax=viral metagenome TaxID=1070528 RepID=A0A6M3LRE0_9ZZZZ
MKMIKMTTINTGWFQKEQVMTIRECKTGYPQLPDWRKLKEALSEFVRCKMEEVDDA